MFLDSHAHLDGSQFASDREAAIQRAYVAGIRALLAIGNGDGPDDIACAIPFAEQYPWIYASIGVHPHEARLLTPAHLVTMESLSRHPRVIAIGEIGLDYWYDYSPREIQQQVFRQQLDVAAAVKLPILIHCRPSLDSDNAWDDLLAILHEQWAPTGLGGVMHCFTGNLAQARTSLDFHALVCRKHQLPESPEHSRCSHNGPARPLFSRNRLSLPRSYSSSRQAQRTGLRR
jgi:TatD DNase family protein